MQAEKRRHLAVLAAAAALIAGLVAVVVMQHGPVALEKAAKSTGGDATSITGIQLALDRVMDQERKEGEIARDAMMEKEKKEAQLETAKDGLQAFERKGTGEQTALARHHSIQTLQQQIADATKRAETAKAARKKLQTQLDKDLNKLANAQFKAHAAAPAVKAKGLGTAKAKPAAAKPAAKNAPKAKPAARPAPEAKTGVKARVTARVTAKARALIQGQESVLAGMEMEVLSMPKVRAALKQSLSSKELSIADEVAKSLGSQVNITGIDEAITAEAAVAAAEQDKDMPLLEDGATPALNFTAPPLADALLKDFEQAQVEVDIDKKHA